ncbi:MAG: 50S ribosomal protein L21e [Candidatus Bathyarchaeia archaeon]
MPNSRGYKSRTRKVLRKRADEKYLSLRITPLLYRYKPGDRVVIDIDPSVHKGMPHRRYQGRIAVVSGMKGRAYILEVKVGDKVRQIIARPEHIHPWIQSVEA